MLDHEALQLALRARLRDLEVCRSTAFARASTATYHDEDGVVQTAAVDELRDAHYVSGSATTLYEGAATNAALWSEDLTQSAHAASTGVTYSANADTAPDGSLAADKLVEDTSTGTHFHRQDFPAIVASGTPCTVSRYLKADERTNARLTISNGVSAFASFDLDAGAVGTTGGSDFTAASIVAIGSNWYRCSMTANVDSGAVPRFLTSLLDASGTASYTGDGSSGVLCWGGQIEVDASAATSYIPTTTAAVTRAADSDPLIAATSTGYTRTTGSFITDGFRVGQELLAAGFTNAGNNGPAVIKSVAATALTVHAYTVATDYSVTDRKTVTEAAVAGRSLIVGLPARQSYENAEIDGIAGIPMIEENYVPATSSMRTFPFDGGTLDDDGLYVINWYGVAGKGIAGLRRCVQAVLEHFAPGAPVTVSGASVRIGYDQAPTHSQIEQDNESGFAVCTITIPWQADTTNAVPA